MCNIFSFYVADISDDGLKKKISYKTNLLMPIIQFKCHFQLILRIFTWNFFFVIQEIVKYLPCGLDNDVTFHVLNILFL